MEDLLLQEEELLKEIEVQINGIKIIELNPEKKEEAILRGFKILLDEKIKTLFNNAKEAI
ncbi:MAG: hypothetical protein N2448_06845 [Caloramator sp.]|nr:hypothetical protein [Caloramator sp.]